MTVGLKTAIDSKGSLGYEALFNFAVFLKRQSASSRKGF